MLPCQRVWKCSTIRFERARHGEEDTGLVSRLNPIQAKPVVTAVMPEVLPFFARLRVHHHKRNEWCWMLANAVLDVVITRTTYLWSLWRGLQILPCLPYRAVREMFIEGQCAVISSLHGCSLWPVTCVQGRSLKFEWAWQRLWTVEPTTQNFHNPIIPEPIHVKCNNDHT